MSSTDDFDRWTEEFAVEWMRRKPQSATRSQYFSGEAQDANDRKLALENVYGGVFGVEESQAAAQLAQRGLQKLTEFDGAALSAEQQTSAAIIEHRLRDVAASANFAQHRFVFNSFVGLHLSLVTFLSTMHPLRNERDAENYLARLEQVAPRLHEGIAQADAAGKNGFVPPGFILSRAIEQLNQLTGCSPSESPLVANFARGRSQMGALAPQQSDRFVERAHRIVETAVNPALRSVRDLLQTQLAQARDVAGAWSLPDGDAYYAHCLASITGTSMSAKEIHEIGLREVARIEREMDGLLRRLGFPEGTMKQRVEALNETILPPHDPDPRPMILQQLQEIVDDAQRRSELSFDLRPSAPVIVLREPAYSEKSAAAHYTTPAPDGSRPGVYWAPLADLTPKVMWLGTGTKTTCYHEAIPGHHFQLALQQEMRGLPRFRKYDAFGFDVAFVEGWALYAEHFCDEDGWYEGDLPSRVGYLEAQLFRARRLVADTGIHAFRWTKQQAMDYGFTEAEIERYFCWPGQATAYMVGFLRILELREKAKRALGDRFSIKAFHNAMLRGGGMPLDVLAHEIDRWVNSLCRS
jgi:uncharacterized protein (DUF885 family)